MTQAVPFGIAWGVIVLLVCGVASAVLARISCGTCLETLAHGLVFVLMGLIGIVTFAALLIGPGHGLFVGSTLSIMAVVTVFDGRRLSKAAVSSS